MLGDKELQSLVEYRGEDKVLSLYLDTDLAHKSKEAIKLMFRQCVRYLDDKAAASDVESASRYLDYEFDWRARGLAVFSAGPQLWRTFALPIPVRTQAFYMPMPYVGLLTDVLDRFGEYCVALVDSESVRLFSVAGGEIQAAGAAYGEEVKRHRQGGRSAARMQRHTDMVRLQNLRQAVEVIQQFMQDSDCQRFMLAGKAEVLAHLKELMPRPVSFQVMGEFNADMEATPSEILVRSLDVAMQVDTEQERSIVSRVATSAAKGGQGVTGLADTLYALQQGRVHLLLVAEGFTSSGYACSGCGYGAADHSGKCPFCGLQGMQPVPDVVNRAIQRAIQTGARVNIVRQNEELAGLGNIAAELRY